MATPNSLNPSFNRVNINGGATIFSGASTTDQTIKAEVGEAGVGDIYISTNGSGEIWVGIQGDSANVWTQLTIN